MTPQIKTEHRHAIVIEHDGHRFIYKNPETNQPAEVLKVKRGDVIHWHSNRGNFSILFKKDSPFSEVGLHGKRGERTKEALVTGDAGEYHYAVALVPEGHGEPLVDDPVIIVGD